MSRYEWQSNNLTVAAGWDRPMKTFFIQVHNDELPEDEESCIVWLGGLFHEYPELPQLVADLPDWIEIPEELKSKLEADRADDPTAPEPADFIKRIH